MAIINPPSTSETVFNTQRIDASIEWQHFKLHIIKHLLCYFLEILGSLETLNCVFHKTMNYKINNDGRRINTKEITAKRCSSNEICAKNIFRFMFQVSTNQYISCIDIVHDQLIVCTSVFGYFWRLSKRCQMTIFIYLSLNYIT